MLDILDRPKTLKESALEKLREAITLGVFKPGERLVERAMCERLGVSRTVVRECIRHLESEWLVTVIPNSGPLVTHLDANEVREIYEIRTLLECAAVRSCTKHATKGTIQRLKQHNKQIAKSMATGDIIKALSQTRLFYETIFTAGGKTVSWGLVERLNGRISRLRALTLSSKGRASTGPANLNKIVVAIERGDEKAAVKACEKHLTEASRIALAQLDVQENSTVAV